MLAIAVSGELISSEIEIRSGRGEDVQHALSLQREARRRLFALADKHGAGLASTGTHPLSDYRDQHIIDTEHYHRVQDGLQYVAHRNNTFALQVHVGVQGGDRAIQVCDRLRPVLPMLLAISANSPFVDGRDSGLHSARTQTFTKSFPRCGVPDPFGSWANWQELREPAACGRTRSSSTRSCGGRCGRITPTGRSRCGSATRRPPATGGRRADRADRGLCRAGAAGDRRGRGPRRTSRAA